MTYCLGILLPSGLVLASDARSNAGVDQVARVLKLNTLTVPGERMIAIQSAGNLATAMAQHGQRVPPQKTDLSWLAALCR